MSLEKLQAAMNRSQDKFKVLEKHVAYLVNEYNLASRDGEAILTALSKRPPEVLGREWNKLFSTEAQGIPFDTKVHGDTAAIMHTCNPDAKWRELTKNEKDVARRKFTRYTTPVPFPEGRPSQFDANECFVQSSQEKYDVPYMQKISEKVNVKGSTSDVPYSISPAPFSGRHIAADTTKPSHPYTWLVYEYIDIIEKHAGRDFGFYRSPRKENNEEDGHPPTPGKPSGPMMNVLMAALDLALFASDNLSVETVADIVKERRKNKPAIQVPNSQQPRPEHYSKPDIEKALDAAFRLCNEKKRD